MPQVCSIEGCGKKHAAHGWCNSHYIHWRKHGYPVSKAPRLRLHTHCTIDGCDKRHYSFGLCSAHYTRQYRGQDVTTSYRQRVKEVPIDQIVSLYVNEQLSTVKLAEQFGIADVTISAMLKNAGVAIRGIRGPRIHMRGSNHPNWDASRSNENRMLTRHVPEVALWRTAVRAKDHFECQSCGSDRHLHAHHIESWSTCPEKRFDVSNGITLCQSCHFEFHKRYGKRHNDRLQLAEFLNAERIAA